MAQRQLSVLYVGNLGSDRSAAFELYLKECFGTVQVADIDDLGALEYADADVLVVDGEPILYVDGMPQVQRVPEGLTVDTFPRPTVLIGGIGGAVSDAIGLKFGWHEGCVSLDHRAIFDEGTAHPVFAGPFEVPPIESTSIPSPDNFAHYAKVKNVPATVSTVDIALAQGNEEELQVEMKRASAVGDRAATLAAMQSLPTPGLVSTSAGFLDSPDCERICGGINMKAHDYVAIGRQGRFLQWGFHADPSDMTPLGRALFANVVAYIATFAGAPVEALRVAQSRDALAVSLSFADSGSEERISQLFGGTAPAGIGVTSDEALSWLVEHRPYVRHVGSGPAAHWQVDDDAMALGPAIDSVTLLDGCLEQVEQGFDADRSRRLWKRYTHRPLDDVATERAWLEANRGDMFFSDCAGYRWIVRSDLPSLRPTDVQLTGNDQVRATLNAHRDATVVRAWVKVHIIPGHYVYAPGAADGVPVAVGLPDGSPFTLLDVVFPPSEDGHLSGYQFLELTLEGAGDVLTVLLAVQSCDEQSCQPPTTLTLHCPVTHED